jgi:endonuclease/exonuclease/phosphatase (EEP) superfamily protein YafD
MSQIALALPRPGRLVEVAAWVLLVPMIGVVVSQWVGVDGSKLVAALQPATPYFVVAALPMAAAALVTRHWVLAAASIVVAVAVTAMAWPLLRPADEPAARAGSTPVSVFHSNLLYRNNDTDPVIATLLRTDADVLAFTEYTPAHARAFHDSELAARYPHRLELPGAKVRGSAVWSRFPVALLPGPPIGDDPILVTVSAPHPFTLYVVHPTSPMVDAEELSDQLDELATSGLEGAGPTLVVGDFNADYWHPAFRDLLAVGWRDAHIASGRGFTSSWPDDRRPVPPLVRLDHALVNDDLTVVGVADVHVPGSDHVGFTVTVAPVA